MLMFKNGEMQQMTTVYIFEELGMEGWFAIDAQESIHTYTPDGEMHDCMDRGSFFGYFMDFYEIEGREADEFLKSKGW